MMFNTTIFDRLRRAFVLLLLIYCGTLFLGGSPAYAADSSCLSVCLPHLWPIVKWAGIVWFIGAVIGLCYVTSPRSGYLGFIPVGIFLCWLVTVLAYGLYNSPDWGYPWSTMWRIWKFSGILWLLSAIASIFVFPDDAHKYPWLGRLSTACWSLLVIWFATMVITGLFV